MRFSSGIKVTECPKCSSKSIKWYTRIIGYLRAIKNFGKERQIEAEKRKETMEERLAEKRQRVNQSLLKRKMAKPSKEDIEK